jgi:hypothetical protein
MAKQRQPDRSSKDLISALNRAPVDALIEILEASGMRPHSTFTQAAEERLPLLEPLQKRPNYQRLEQEGVQKETMMIALTAINVAPVFDRIFREVRVLPPSTARYQRLHPCGRRCKSGDGEPPAGARVHPGIFQDLRGSTDEESKQRILPGQEPRNINEAVAGFAHNTLYLQWMRRLSLTAHAPFQMRRRVRAAGVHLSDSFPSWTADIATPNLFLSCCVQLSGSESVE